MKGMEWVHTDSLTFPGLTPLALTSQTMTPLTLTSQTMTHPGLTSPGLMDHDQGQ